MFVPIASFVSLLALGTTAATAEDPRVAAPAKTPAGRAEATAIDQGYVDSVRPLLKRFCFDCHSGRVTEAEVDLGGHATAADARKNLKAWIKVRAMLDTRQMPPRDAPQPNEDEREKLRNWTRRFLAHEARSRAGDPGPVLLRRLNNAEYAWTIRDLTGVASLDPTQEFPVDGGAGEGFTNAGSGQAMSPALVQKYLDAGKSIAAHAVLIPDGLRFSPGATRRDQTDELVAQVKAFQSRFAENGDRLPLRRYLVATLTERDALRNGKTTIARVAAERSLSPKYLETLWKILNEPARSSPEGTAASPLLEPVRAAWRSTTNNDPGPTAALIEAWHPRLWKNNPIGHLGREGKPKAWLEPVSPFVARQEIRVPLSNAPRGQDASLWLSAADLGDGRAHDVVVVQQPRIEFKTDKGPPRPPIPLRDLRWFSTGYERMVAAESAKTARYLDAVRTLGAADAKSEGKDGATEPVNRAAAFDRRLAELARERSLDPKLLARWVTLGGLRGAASRQIVGHFKTTVAKVHGHDTINGWGTDQLPVLLTNRSKETISFITITMPARGVTLHPSPAQDGFVAWKSPIAGTVRIHGRVADADDKCGNGAGWRLERTTVDGPTTLASGTFDSGKSQEIVVEKPVAVAIDDVLTVAITARDKNHACDTTQVEWEIVETDGAKQTWNLADQIVDRVLQGNPLPDTFGHEAVWHFGATGGAAAVDPVPAGSSLARWRAAARGNEPAERLERSANEVQQSLTAADAAALPEADRALRDVLLSAGGPLGWASLRPAATEPANVAPSSDAKYGIDPNRFGRAPDGSPVDAGALVLHAPESIEVRFPGGLFAGGELVASAVLHPVLGKGGTAQVVVSSDKPTATTPEKPALAIAPGAPILAAEDEAGPLQAAVREFRSLFPAALCYAPIVPLDEVVTLTLYHREDEHLRRLMLDDRQTSELDRLWDELLFVAQEPIALTVAFEQISEFATQDRPDLVKEFAPLKKPIFDRADAFRKRLTDTEPAQLEAALRFADQAWRRPLSEEERRTLRDLYSQLRRTGLEHDPALRLLLARVLTSPAFLFKIERPGPAADSIPVSDLELATRLSYFLWSSAPDAELRKAAESGTLRDASVLKAQMKRMLADEKACRLSVEFACQWMHLRDFDRQNDKNESLFPEFAALRGPMYEETVRFLDDLFRQNGSILTLLDADHTFLNEALAKHYGVEGVSGAEWRRVEGMRARGRGGLLGMATVLASQSGASRTSPILRGNWVYETILGERLPRPPANVPRLPDAPPEGLTERQLIEKHSSVESCARCHMKIDPFGFALEQFDTIGRLRPQKIDVKTTLSDGTKIEGLDGLRGWLTKSRRSEFVRQFCRKLLGYALGRETQLSDEPLLEEMERRMEADGWRFHSAVETVVTSRPFRDIRGRDAADD